MMPTIIINNCISCICAPPRTFVRQSGSQCPISKNPKRPKTTEAVILYYLDDMDSKVQSIQALIEKEKENISNWTSYHRLYERYIYKGSSRGSLPGEDSAEEETENLPQNNSGKKPEGNFSSVSEDKSRKELLEEDLFTSIRTKPKI